MMKKIFTTRNCSIASGVLALLFLLQLQSYESSSVSLNEKEQKLKFQTREHFHKMTHKLKGSLNVKLHALNEYEANSPNVYTATITSDSRIEIADYKWILPQGMEMVQGQLTGHVGPLAAGATQVLEVTVQSPIEENQQIHFHISSQDGGARFTASDQYNTVIQAELNEKIKVLHEKTKEASKKGVLQ